MFISAEALLAVLVCVPVLVYVLYTYLFALGLGFECCGLF